MSEQNIDPVENVDDIATAVTESQPSDIETTTAALNGSSNDVVEDVIPVATATAVQPQDEGVLVGETTAVVETTPPAEFDPLDALTSLLVGGAVQGSSELLKRLQRYEQEIREEKAEAETEDTQVFSESDIEWLRYTLIGFIFEQQGFLRRGISMAARLANQSTNVAAKAASPLVKSRYINPLQRRYDQLVQRVTESVARWTQIGRVKEPEGRELARKMYREIIDEFIEQLAENEELQDLVTQQGLSLAGEVRDEVRERTVTGDNVLEGVVRRILRRTPRAELPLPPEEVQKWAQFTFEDRKKLD